MLHGWWPLCGYNISLATIATLSMSSELPLVISTDLHIESETLLGILRLLWQVIPIVCESSKRDAEKVSTWWHVLWYIPSVLFLPGVLCLQHELAAVLSWGAWRTSDPLCVGCVLLTWDFFYILKALCVLEWLSLFLVLRYTIHVQYAIVIEKVVSVELDFLEFSYISRYYKFSSPLLDRINSTSLWLGQSTFFAFILHSGNLKRIAAGDFGACNYTDFVAEAVGGCEKKFYSNLATDLTADCRYV